MKEEIEKIIRAYEQGYSLRAVGRKIGRSHLFVWKILKKFNPDILRPPRLWHKFSFAHRYFRDWTPENSYWMGFIDADGHVNVKRARVEVKLHGRDIDRLVALRNAVNGNFPIYQFKTRPQAGILMVSKEMVNDLIQKGIGVKSPCLKPPIGIPEDCVRHFIRGYFDGDGSISLSWSSNGVLRPLFQILGSKCCLEWMNGKLIEQAGVKSSINIRFREGCWALGIGSRRSLIKIRDYFYDNVDESLFMKRKKEKFYVEKMELITTHPKWL